MSKQTEHEHDFKEIYNSGGVSSNCSGDGVLWCKKCGLTKVLREYWNSTTEDMSTVYVTTFKLGVGRVGTEAGKRKNP